MNDDDYSRAIRAGELLEAAAISPAGLRSAFGKVADLMGGETFQLIDVSNPAAPALFVAPELEDLAAAYVTDGWHERDTWTRTFECWEDDVKDGKVTDFRRAVQAKSDEAVVFSWVEWPDKATRDAAVAKMDDLMKTDPRMNPEINPMPFDGKRMIYGGFSPVLMLGE